MTNFNELKAKLSDKRWRLTSGNLYRIKDVDGKEIPFIPNKHQIKLYLALMKYDLIVIPKARQLGFSTAVQIWILDDFLWRYNSSFGVIARTREDAEDLFDNKVKFAWDHFPAVLKYKEDGTPRRVMSSDRKNEIACSNRFNKLRVSTTFRGGTLQFLHVSEFGPICAESPDQAKEIVDGALQAVHQGNKTVIESTSAGAEGEFFDICMLAKKVADEGREPMEMERKLLFFPRWEEENYAVDINAPLPADLVVYFTNLEKDHGILLTHQQKMWYAKKRELLKERMFREYPSTLEECFAMVLEGTYYEKELTLTRQNRRICSVPYEEGLEVHTAWDLGGAGGGDDMTVVFFQIYGKEIRVIDYWEGNQVSLVWVIENVIKKKEYNYGKHYAPHDINVTELSYGQTRREAAHKVGLRFTILPITKKVSDDIELVRNHFSQVWFDNVNADKLITRLSNYRRRRHSTMRIHLDEPMKNGAQHGADCFRYMMLAIFDETNRKEDAVITNIG